MFKIIKSDGPEIEIWQIFDLCSKENTWKRRLIAELFLTFIKSGSSNPKEVVEVLNL